MTELLPASMNIIEGDSKSPCRFDVKALMPSLVRRILFTCCCQYHPSNYWLCKGHRLCL